MSYECRMYFFATPTCTSTGKRQPSQRILVSFLGHRMVSVHLHHPTTGVAWKDFPPAAGFNTMFRACVPLKLSPTETIENTIETPQSQINFKNSNNHPTWKRDFSCQRVARKRETRSWWESWGFLTMADHGLWRMQFFEGQQVSGQGAHCHVSQKGKVKEYKLTLNARQYGERNVWTCLFLKNAL